MEDPLSVKEYIKQEMEINLTKDQSKRLNLLGRQIKQQYTSRNKKSPKQKKIDFRGQKIGINVYTKKDFQDWIEDEILKFYDF